MFTDFIVKKKILGLNMLMGTASRIIAIFLL